jgi:hypothetical protein
VGAASWQSVLFHWANGSTGCAVTEIERRHHRTADPRFGPAEPEINWFCFRIARIPSGAADLFLTSRFNGLALRRKFLVPLSTSIAHVRPGQPPRASFRLQGFGSNALRRIIRYWATTITEGLRLAVRTRRFATDLSQLASGYSRSALSRAAVSVVVVKGLLTSCISGSAAIWLTMVCSA